MEVLVFWCFKSVRWAEFCLLELFLHRAFPTPYKAGTLIYTLGPIQTQKEYKQLHLYALRHLRTIQDTKSDQQTPIDVPTQPETPQKVVWGCVTFQVDVEWRLMVFVGGRWYLLVSDCVLFWSGHVRRVSEECLKGYLSALYGIV